MSNKFPMKNVVICKPFRHEKNVENNRSKMRPTYQF